MVTPFGYGDILGLSHHFPALSIAHPPNFGQVHPAIGLVNLEALGVANRIPLSFLLKTGKAFWIGLVERFLECAIKVSTKEFSGRLAISPVLVVMRLDPSLGSMLRTRERQLARGRLSSSTLPKRPSRRPFGLSDRHFYLSRTTLYWRHLRSNSQS